MFGKDFNEAMASLFPAPVAFKEPEYCIRCEYKSANTLGTSSFVLPYRYTSETNIRLALDTFRSLGEDTKMLISEHRGLIVGELVSYNFTIEAARG